MLGFDQETDTAVQVARQRVLLLALALLHCITPAPPTGGRQRSPGVLRRRAPGGCPRGTRA